MNRLSEIINIKIEPNDTIQTDQYENSIGMQISIVKQENEYLINSEFDIKNDHQQNANEFLGNEVIDNTFYQNCNNDGMKIEISEPFVKIEHERIKKDPDSLDIRNEPKEIFKYAPDQEILPTRFQNQEIPRFLINITDFLVENNNGEHFLSGLHEERNNVIGVNKDEESSLLQNNTIQSEATESGTENQLKNNKNPNESERKKYICNMCNKILGQKSNLDRHLFIHSGKRPFTCNICNKSFIEKRCLKRHMFTHTDKKPYVCNECNKGFQDKSALNLHIVVHTIESGKPYSCDECNKLFTRKDSLVKHKQKHNGDFKTYACDVCAKIFSKKCNLMRHNLIHTGERPFSCNVCGRTFLEKINYIAHTYLHTGEKPFSCDGCNESFIRKRDLARHKQKYEH